MLSILTLMSARRNQYLGCAFFFDLLKLDLDEEDRRKESSKSFYFWSCSISEAVATMMLLKSEVSLTKETTMNP